MEPHVTGVMMNNAGSTNTVTMMNVGTILKLKTRVMPEGLVVLELNIQDARSGPTEEGAAIATLKDGKSIRSPSTDLLSYQSTLRLQDGQPQTVSAITRNGKTCQITVTAHIIHP
jgi:general secretion pathway protein D